MFAINALRVFVYVKCYLCLQTVQKKEPTARPNEQKNTINCFQSWIFLLLEVKCHFSLLSQCQYFQRSIFNQGLFIRFSTAVAGVTCPRHLESFFLRPVQLCNYFHCALPVESSPKLHVSRCGKYMTFGAASPWENNEKNCAMPVAQWSFFFFLFVRLCVCFSFFAGTEVALVTQLRWTLLEKTGAAIDHLRLRSFIFFSRNSEQHASKKWNKTKLSSSR